MAIELVPESYPNSPEASGHLNDCDVILILQNQHGTSADAVHDQVERLRDVPRIDFGKGKQEYVDVFTDIDRLTTIEEIGVACQKVRSINPEARIGLINAGGDHTQNIGLEAALLFKIDTVGLFKGGNVNALASMVNKNRDADDMTRIIRNGAPGVIRPVKITATRPGGKKTDRLIFAFWGSGVTSAVANKANAKDHRLSAKNLSDRQLFMVEAGMTLEAIAEQPPLLLEDDTAGERPILDLSVVIGPKLAKAIKIGRNKLTDPKAAVLETAYPNRRNKALKLGAAGLAMAKARVGVYDRLEMGQAAYEFRLSSDDSKRPTISAHFEGEPEEFPSGTDFMAAVYNRVVKIQATRSRF